MVNKPYIKKFGNISKFVVWTVDGNYIRKNIDEEFTNFGQHYQFNFIPKNEFWIDKGGRVGEEKYFIDCMLVMHRLMSKGISRKIAAAEADKREKAERNKSKLMKFFYRAKPNQEKILEQIHLKLFKRYSNKKIRVWLVNGELVRSLYFLDFTQGGHDKVYRFIPKNEIWIDDDVAPREIRLILLHEVKERNLMCKRWHYNHAHMMASKIEYLCRHNPKLLANKLRNELKKSKHR